MDKSAVFQTILNELRDELKRRTAAAKESAAVATDAESKAEDKYDTRATESSYLARGQAMAVEEMAEDVRILEGFTLPESCSVARPGALVEVDLDGEELAFFLLPRAGGVDVTVDRKEITVVTPTSPIGERLQGKFAGDSFQLGEGGANGKVLAVS